MTVTVEAVFEGKDLHSVQPLDRKPHTRVRVTIEAIEDGARFGSQAPSFWDLAASLNLEGPAGWSENVDKYRYDKSIQN